jgi:hypothetical protein
MLFACLLSTLAVPLLWDFHYSTVSLQNLDKRLDSSKASHFAVAIDRVDAIMDTKDLLATKIQHLVLAITVSPEAITLNNATIPIGSTDITVSAKILVGIKPDAVTPEVLEQLQSGIVGIRVSASAVQITRNGLAARRIVIAEEIREINGHELKTKSLVQQIFEIMPDGSINSRPCKMPSMELLRLERSYPTGMMLLVGVWIVCSLIFLYYIAAWFFSSVWKMWRYRKVSSDSLESTVKPSII